MPKATRAKTNEDAVQTPPAAGTLTPAQRQWAEALGRLLAQRWQQEQGAHNQLPSTISPPPALADQAQSPSS